MDGAQCELQEHPCEEVMHARTAQLPAAKNGVSRCSSLPVVASASVMRGATAPSATELPALPGTASERIWVKAQPDTALFDVNSCESWTWNFSIATYNILADKYVRATAQRPRAWSLLAQKQRVAAVAAAAATLMLSLPPH